MILDLNGIIFIAFLVATMVVGIASSRGITTIKEYAVGNRDFSTATIAATLVATWISGSDFFTYLSEAYTNGLYFIWAATGDVVYLLLIGLFFAPRLGEFLGKLSIADAMGGLYGKYARIITAIAGCISASGMIAVQLKVAGLLFEYCFNVAPGYGIATAGLIVATYSSLGGIRSVTFTDVIQLFTFGTVIPTMAFFILQSTDFSVVVDTVKNNPLFDYSQVFDFSRRESFTYLLLFFFIMVPGFGPALFQRMSMAKNTEQVRRSFLIAAATCLFITFSMSWIGVVTMSANPDIAPSEMVKTIIFSYSYPGIKGLILAGIMAMVMSTADSHVNSTSVLFVHDFCRPLGLKVANNELAFSRVVSFLVTIFSLGLALTGDNLLNLIITTRSFYLPVVTVPFIMATLGFRTSSKAVLIAMFAGLSTVIIWKIFVQTEAVDSVIPGMLANLVFLLGSHYLLKQPGGWVGIKDHASLEQRRHERRQAFVDIIRSIKRFSIIDSLQKNNMRGEAMYSYFGIFCMVSIFSVMHAVPKEVQLMHADVINLIYPLVLFTATILISYPLWLRNWKGSKLISIIWSFSVFFVLICVSFYMVLISNFGHLPFIAFMINLIVISILMRWQWAVVMMACGGAITALFFKWYLGLESLSDGISTGSFETTYLLLLVSAIIIIFLRPKQQYQDITEEKNEHLRGRITLQEEELREALNLKSAFIRNISHEYHAPMTGITSMAEILLESYDNLTDEQLLSGLDTIVKSSRRLDVFDTNISTLSLLSKPSYKLDLNEIDFGEFLQDRVDVCRKLYEEDKQNRQFVLEIQNGVIVKADTNYLSQAIDNLLINALSYCAFGKITIALKAEGDKAICAISDEGIGIPPLELSDIFAEFSVSSKTKSFAGGRGVGLSVAKHVIERHGGRIWAESDGKKGARFIFELPI